MIQRITIILLIVLAIIAIATIGAYIYYVKNSQQQTISETGNNNIPIQESNVTLDDLKGTFLTHKISLAQLQINNARSEEGNGALLYQQLLKLNTSDQDQVKNAVEILNQLAKKKDFSIYPEIIPYPKTLADFTNAQLFTFTGTSKIIDDVINYANNLPTSDPQKEIIFKNILVLGRQLTLEKDFSTTIQILIGIGVENKATQNLINLYNKNQRTDLVNTYQSYKNEDKAFKDRMSFFLTKFPIYAGMVYGYQNNPQASSAMAINQIRQAVKLNEKDIINYFDIVDKFEEPAMQGESLISLMAMLYSSKAELESSSARKVLENYANGKNEIIGNLAKQILNPVNKDKISEIMKKIQEENSNKE